MNVPDPLLPKSKDVVGRDGAEYSLACCPFCGEVAEVYLELDLPGELVEEEISFLDDASHWVSCDHCGCTGPASDTEAEAVGRWNDRMAGLALSDN